MPVISTGPGRDAPGAAYVVALRGMVNRLNAEKRTDAILSGGFFGRGDELSHLADYLAQPQSGIPLRAVYISGLAGIGKSHLLERCIQMARLDQQPVIVRLDFDRSGLDVRDSQSFFDEISRQVGDSLPQMAATLRDLRLKTAQNDIALTMQARREDKDEPPNDTEQTLLETVAAAINDAGKMLLIVLDTLEVLRSEGETRIIELFERLDQLAIAGTERMAIIAAGRGFALEPAPDRLWREPVYLSGLEQQDVAQLLTGYGVPGHLWPRINRLAEGNPLFLLLAAKAVMHDDFDEAEIPADLTAETVGGYLYRAILSRVPTRLRELAREGLILNTVDFAALRDVVAPIVAPDETEADLRDLFDQLKTQVWLVEEDTRTQSLRHRADVRRAFLPLIYAAQPDTTAAINERAMTWYADQGRRFEALYHQLQLYRAGRPLPDNIPADLARRFRCLHGLTSCPMPPATPYATPRVCAPISAAPGNL